MAFPRAASCGPPAPSRPTGGIDYEFVALTPGDHKQPDHLARHPYGKVPSLIHDDVLLYESSAIARYLDEAFDGPSLQGATPRDRALVTQWISVVNCYLYNQVVMDLLFPFRKGDMSDDALANVTARIQHTLTQLEGAIGTGTWLVGDQITLADYFVGPLLFVLGMLEPGQRILAEFPAVGRLMTALKESSSLMAAAPPQ